MSSVSLCSATFNVCHWNVLSIFSRTFDRRECGFGSSNRDAESHRAIASDCELLNRVGHTAQVVYQHDRRSAGRITEDEVDRELVLRFLAFRQKSAVPPALRRAPVTNSAHVSACAHQDNGDRWLEAGG